MPPKSRGTLHEDLEAWAHPEDASGDRDRRAPLEDLERDALVEIVMALQEENAELKSQRDRMREEISRLRNDPAEAGDGDGAR